MNLPVEVAPGQDISAKAFNSMIRYLRSLKLTGGPGIWVTQTMGGTTIKLAPDDTIQSAGRTNIEHPFMVSNASGATTAAIKVKTGSVNDTIPTGVAPTTKSLTSAGTWSIYLACTISLEGALTAVSVEVVNGSQPADTDYAAHITLAIATVGAITGGFSVTDIEQLATHSLRFFACGRKVEEGALTARGTYNFWGF